MNNYDCCAKHYEKTATVLTALHLINDIEGSSAICWTSPTFEFLPKFDRGWMNSVQVSVHCSGSSWQIQRSSSTLRSAWLKIDQKISRAKPDKTYGLQDLSRPQLLTGRDRLCERLRSSEGARFRHKMQGQGWTVQVLYKEECSLLPWVQVSKHLKAVEDAASDTFFFWIYEFICR